MRKFSHLLGRLFLIASIVVLVTTIRIGSASDASDCAVTGASDNVVLIICPPGLDQEAWHSAGENACMPESGICNAWIWDNIENAPQKAPATDSEMSKDQVAHALAVWVNDAKRLIILGKVDQSN